MTWISLVGDPPGPGATRVRLQRLKLARVTQAIPQATKLLSLSPAGKVRSGQRLQSEARRQPMALHPSLCWAHTFCFGCGEQRPRRWVAEQAAKHRRRLRDFFPRLSISQLRAFNFRISYDLLVREEEQHFLIRMLNYWSIVLYLWSPCFPRHMWPWK